MRGSALVLVLLGLWPLVQPAALEAQISWRDFVVTGGVSAEGYQGNLTTAGAAVQDSTDVAAAVVSEMGARGGWIWRRGGETRGVLEFDGGVRQFTASGFELRDYAPREWVGMAELTLFQPTTDWLLLSGFGRVRGRQVEDRPPMPLFLPPAYRLLQGGLGIQVDAGGARRLNLTVSGERSDYDAPEFAPQVQLLDRRASSARLGLTMPRGANGTIEIFARGELSRYPEQSTFVTDDPFRRDRGWNVGVEWIHQGPRLLQLGGQLRTNRSNSERPEYDSITLEGLFSTPAPAATVVSVYGALTFKRYREATRSARLIPGEEANNASLAYLSVTRGLARNLDGTFRVGWTRAETEIGGEYFQRFGVYALLRYRPGF